MSDNRELIARLNNPTLREFNPEAAFAIAVGEHAVETLARIAQLDISATKSIEDLVAPWRRLSTEGT